MPVFLPPSRASHAKKVAYLVAYLGKMADNNRRLADAYKTSENVHGEPCLTVEQYYRGRAAAFAEAASCLTELDI